MTQLIIAGVETVLPQSFSVTVKRENSFFTKSGEYTYDCTLRLDNPVNQQLYGFLHRLNRSSAPAGSPGGSPASLATRRTAILIADGHVYCRGTEVITKWTDQTVSIQIVSGESELNFFVGQDQKIETLDLGELTRHTYDHTDSRTGTTTTYTVFDEDGVYPESDYCCVIVRLPNGSYVNRNRPWTFYGSPECPQPYLCLIIRRLMTALGYTIGLNQLEDTQFKNLFLVNTIPTSQLAKTLPGWTVKDFLTEVERLTGIVFITDNTDPTHLTVDIVLKTVFYQDARQLEIRNVVDEYESEVMDEDGREEEFTTSNVSYDIPDSYWKNLYKLPEGFLDQATVIDYTSLSAILQAPIMTTDPSIVYRDASTGRCYVLVNREKASGQGTETFWQEINQYGDLKRQDVTSELELKITPAPMGYAGGVEFIDLGTTDPAYTETGTTEVTPEEEETNKNAIDIIRSYSSDESSAIDLYCAFFTGAVATVTGNRRIKVAFTDAYHACLQLLLHNISGISLNTDGITGSLRLADLDADYYQGGYQIDTAHAVTFQTFDPNHIDVRQVYVIGNKRYVVRDVEETITAEGRQPMWRVTCYPIRITDEAIENRWILTRGVWDDGGAWLDDGRWNDGN